jgi:hypothetical protein
VHALLAQLKQARDQLLAATQTIFEAVCEELRSSDRDVAHWQRTAQAVCAAGPVTQRLKLMARRFAVVEPGDSQQLAARPDSVQAHRLLLLRAGQELLLSALVGLREAVAPLTDDLLSAGWGALATRPQVHRSALSVDACVLAAAKAVSTLLGEHEAKAPSAEAGLEYLRRIAAACEGDGVCLPEADAQHGYPFGIVLRQCRRPPAWLASLPRIILFAAGTAASVRWLLSASRSGDLARWSRTAREAVADAYNAHVAAPLRAVYAELFTTFRARPGGVITDQAMDASRESLKRQLADFAASHGGSRGDGSDAHVELLMRWYERQAERPLYGLLFGDLAQALLVQIQQLKTDGEAAMRSMDQVLRANELTISLVAALPGMAIVTGIFTGLGALLRRRPPADPAHATAALRRHLEAASRALSAQEAAQLEVDACDWSDGRMEKPCTPPWHDGRVLLALDSAHAAAAALLAPDVGGRASPGAAAVRAAQLAEAAVAGGSAPRTAEHREEVWHAVQADLLFVADTSVPASCRLRAAERLLLAHGR